METVRSQAIDTDKGDASWPAKWGYHVLGGAANFIPVVGDAVQRGVDAGAYAWQLEEQARIDGIYLVQQQIGSAAFDGNGTANGVAGT